MGSQLWCATSIGACLQKSCAANACQGVRLAASLASACASKAAERKRSGPAYCLIVFDATVADASRGLHLHMHSVHDVGLIHEICWHAASNDKEPMPQARQVSVVPALCQHTQAK